MASKPASCRSKVHLYMPRSALSYLSRRPCGSVRTAHAHPDSRSARRPLSLDFGLLVGEGRSLASFRRLRARRARVGAAMAARAEREFGFQIRFGLDPPLRRQPEIQAEPRFTPRGGRTRRAGLRWWQWGRPRPCRAVARTDAKLVVHAWLEGPVVLDGDRGRAADTRELEGVPDFVAECVEDADVVPVFAGVIRPDELGLRGHALRRVRTGTDRLEGFGDFEGLGNHNLRLAGREPRPR